MKRKLIQTICASLILVVAAGCGNTNSKNEIPDGMKSELPDVMLIVDDSPSTSVSESNSAAEEPDYEELIGKAKKIYLQSAESMIYHLGEPEEKMIMPSARGKGNDGVYRYTNIIAYTYSEGEENVIGVAVIDNNGDEIYYIPEGKAE